MNALTGTVRLTRLAVHRDRFSVPAWILALAGFLAATTAMWDRGFSNPADLTRDVRVAVESPGIRMLGLASGPKLGAYAMVRDYVLLAVLAALMSIFTVVRHTRQGEETGRAELVGAAVTGRHAPLAAALITTVAANALLAIAVGVALIGVGQPAAGSFVAGAAIAAIGLVFAGVAAVTTQLTSSTRAASGLAAAVLGVSFLLSGTGNMTGHPDASGLWIESAWPSWLSPLGWGQQMRPFGGDHWWPLGLVLVLFLLCVAAAAVLVTRRDFGQGMLPQRAGHANAGRSLRSSFGLAFRLQRGVLLGWCVAGLGFGLVMGGLASEAADSTGAARDWYLKTGGGDQILDAYRASIMQMVGATAAIYTVQVLLRMRAEEAGGPLEPVLAGAVSRIRWVTGYAVTALLGATTVVLLFAVGTGVGAGGALGDPVGQVRDLMVPSLVQLPGILVIGAAVIALIGVLPRFATPASWAVLLWSILAGPLFGTGLNLPGWALDLSPFTHVPKAPAVAVTAAPIIGLLAVIAALVLAGLVSLRRRNLLLPA